ncbi:MAG: hypothetical protein DSO07_05120 [Thermoproteota archaeon]|nr:MAG: hypothetical protein DSO07_05120 [Candidatus Korarchaeota archaeon]
MSFWHPSRASPDFNLAPSGFVRTYTAGASITANQVVSLHTDGKVYPSSSSYPNVIGVALSSASSGGLVNVLVLGIATVVSDGSINPGSPVTFSTSTAGRVVAYTGHSHGVSQSTGTAVTGVSTSTGTFVTGVSTSTDTFVKSISVDKRDFTTSSVLSDATVTTETYLRGIGTDTGWSTDSSGYLRHSHSTTSGYVVTAISKSYATVVTGITSTSGNTVVAGVTPTTGSVVTGVSSTTGSAVTSVSTSTGTFLTGVSISSSISRVIGIALSGATAAGQNITILVLPAWI